MMTLPKRGSWQRYFSVRAVIEKCRPRSQELQLCGNVVCQRNRKRGWQQARIAPDPDIRGSQQNAYRSWWTKTPNIGGNAD
jgi:hypothetical protein